MKIEIEVDPNPADVKAVQNGLTAFNAQHAVPDNYQPLSIFARDDGVVRGGLLGETFWDWLHVSILWLDEAVRGQGLGSEMLRQAEAEAVRRGCANAYLDTLSFQAPDFYLQRGYAVWGEVEGLPPGHRRIFLQKKLVVER